MGPSTQRNPDQREIALMSTIQPPKRVRDELLNSCESLLDAIHLCIQVGRLPHYAVAQRLGIDKGHFARMMSSQAHFPTNKMNQLMQVCGNLAPLQWLAKESGHQVFADPEALELDQLERRREQLLARKGQSTFVNEGRQLAA
jgi:hypothetical protein